MFLLVLASGARITTIRRSALRKCGCESNSGWHYSAVQNIVARIKAIRMLERGDHPNHVKYKRREMNVCPKTNRPLLYLVSAFGLGAVIGWSSPSNADIQQIVIDQTATVNFTPIISGTSTSGPATSYTIYTGRVFGELKPNDPDNNKIITDIDL